jgi:hypothetical protein
MSRHPSLVVFTVVLVSIAGLAAADTPATQPANAPPPVGPLRPDSPPGVYNRQNPAAQEPLPPAPPPPAWQAWPPPPPQAAGYFYGADSSQFAVGHFELNLGAQGYTAYRHGGSDSICFVTGDAAFYILNGLSIGLEGGLAPGTSGDHDDGFDHHRDGLRAEELLGIVRWHCLTAGPLSLYVDGGLGGLHASDGFPTGGHSDNWLGVVGGGVSWRLIDHWYIAGGARYAPLWRDDWGWGDHHHNGGFDAIEYYGGFSFIP